nr:unnamed protein product [Callosobruchus chinensis]
MQGLGYFLGPTMITARLFASSERRMCPTTRPLSLLKETFTL